jgi:RimJ/RimL family protein N-acetyltransferase
MDQPLTSHWPLFDLRIRTERLELRLPTDDDLMALVDEVRRGVHDPTTMPFQVPWTDLPSPELERSFLRFMWQARASWSATDWHMPFVVLESGEPVGVQELRAVDFPTRRVAETGSWLGLRHQGRGIGTEMRAAVLRLAFDGLGATHATSGALSTNQASARISQKLGYLPNGTTIVAPRGVPVEERLFLLRREDWRPDRYPASIEGLDGCLDMFGLPED